MGEGEKGRRTRVASNPLQATRWHTKQREHVRYSEDLFRECPSWVGELWEKGCCANTRPCGSALNGGGEGACGWRGCWVPLEADEGGTDDVELIGGGFAAGDAADDSDLASPFSGQVDEERFAGEHFVGAEEADACGGEVAGSDADGRGETALGTSIFLVMPNTSSGTSSPTIPNTNSSKPSPLSGPTPPKNSSSASSNPNDSPKQRRLSF